MSAQRRLRVVEQPTRAGLYVRVSAVMGRDEETFHSPELQTKAMRAYAEARGLTVVATWQDIDVSGRTFERAGIQKALAAVDAAEIDALIVYDLARFGRNTADSLKNIATLRERGVRVLSTVEQIDDTPEGQFQLGVFLGMAQLYSDQISRRWRQVHEHRASLGLAHGPAPLGYERVKGRLIPNGEADAVRALFTGYAAGRLISHLRWDFSAAVGRNTALVVLKRALRNPVYVGKVRLSGEVFPGVHEPLVSPRTWAAVQRRLSRDEATPPRVLGGGNPVAGLVRCAHCRRAMRMQAENRAAGIIRLRCQTRDEGGDCVGPGAPQLADVEQALVRKIRESYGAIELDTSAVVEQRAARARAVVDVRRLRAELVRLDAALGSAAAGLFRAEVTEDEHRAAVKMLREERAMLLAQLDAAERGAGALPAAKRVRLAEGILDRWDRLLVEEKRRTLLATVEVAWLRRAETWREPVYERLDVHLL